MEFDFTNLEYHLLKLLAKISIRLEHSLEGGKIPYPQLWGINGSLNIRASKK
jgi:hypothetical protein